MVEKIGGVGGLGPIREIGESQKKVEKSKGKKELEKLSPSTRGEVEKVLEEAKKLPDIRQELVEDIKKAIESGNYVIDVENIARKLLKGG
jgi:negative regulator of flagellin synthesis FlgM